MAQAQVAFEKVLRESIEQRAAEIKLQRREQDALELKRDMELREKMALLRSGSSTMFGRRHLLVETQFSL